MLEGEAEGGEGVIYTLNVGGCSHANHILIFELYLVKMDLII